MYPYSNPSFLTRSLNFIKTIKWGSILDGTGKTLGVINQAIPVIYQIKPLFGSAKTLLKITNEIGNSSTIENKKDPVKETESSHNSPIFFIE